MVKFSKEQEESIIKLNRENYSIRKIAETLKISKSQIQRILKALGLKRDQIKLGPKKKLSIRKETVLVRNFAQKKLKFASEGTRWIYNDQTLKFLNKPPGTH